MPQLNEVLLDPEFRALPFDEQIKVAQTLDPDFAGLPATDQKKAMGQLRVQAMKTLTNRQVPVEPTEGFWEKVGRETMGGLQTMITPRQVGGPGGGPLPSLNLPDPTNILLGGLRASPLSSIPTAAGESVGETLQDLMAGTRLSGMPSDIISGLGSAATQAVSPGAIARGTQAVTKGVGRILPGSQAARTEIKIDELKTSVLALTAPESAATVRAQALTNPNLEVPATRLYDALKSIIKNESGASTPDGTLITRAQNLANKINMNNNRLTLADFNREIEDFGVLTGNLKSGGQQISPQYARIFGEMAETLKGTPQGAQLREAARLYRREMAIDEILDEVSKVEIRKRGTTGTDIQANRLLKRLEAKPFIKESFDPGELDDTVKIMDQLISMPAIPPPPSVAVGSGRLLGPAVTGYGIESSLGLPSGSVSGPMALVSGFTELSRMFLPTKTGRTLLKKVLESGPINQTKVNTLTAILRAAGHTTPQAVNEDVSAIQQGQVPPNLQTLGGLMGR